jgi:aminoglycoside phosphotransferase (APT) family kinase protein
MTDQDPPGLPLDALAGYLAAHSPGFADGDRPLTAELIAGGKSNLTYLVSGHRDGRYATWVLRRPPLGHVLATAHDMAREFRVLAALAPTAVPVPEVYLLCQDSEVIGAPFYLMERVRGVVIRAELPPAYEDDVAARAGLGLELVDRLAELHAVDPGAVGLSDFAKPHGYLERQLRRWSGQLDASRTRPLPDLDAVTAWLHDHLPVSGPATIVHGDYRLDNAMYAPQPPARILAILDWEMATLGDPLADLGYLLSFWREAGDPDMGLGDAAWRVSEMPGFCTRHELVTRYAEQSGRRVDAIPFYVALAIWKLAILLEGSYARHLAGTTDDPFFATLDRGVPTLARRALAVCQGEVTVL